MALYVPAVAATRSSRISPLGTAIIRLVNPLPGPVVDVSTTLPATRRTFAVLVVSDPLLDVALVPEAPTPPTSGLAGSSPPYSAIRTSG